MDNYRQIRRIIVASYARIKEDDKKYRGRTLDPEDYDNDIEYRRYLEEKQNTQKMSTILKTLNSPMKRRKTVQALRTQAEKELEVPEGQRRMQIRSRNEFSRKFAMSLP